jgi:hypothetical protein
VDDPDSAEDTGSKNRRLLNTEKIIFKAGSSDPLSVCSSLIYLCARIVARSQNVSGAPFLHVIVTVEPEGVVAKPNVPERELALFNIGMVFMCHYNSFDFLLRYSSDQIS